MDWKTLVMQLSLIVLATNPKTRALAPYIAPAVTATEDLIKPKPGQSKAERNQAKLANAVKLVKIGIASTNAMNPGAVDETISDHLIESAVSVVVDTANLIHKSPAVQPAA